MTDRQNFLASSNPPDANRVGNAKNPHVDTRPAANRGGLLRHRKTSYLPRTSAGEKIWTVDLDGARF